jgi:hypothetical protein
MNLPIPHHLKAILLPIGEGNSEFRAHGSISCECGCTVFSVFAFGKTEEANLIVEQYEDDYSLVVKVKCVSCGKSHLLFDMSKHGWNGFVCHDGVSVPDEKLEAWKCQECGSDTHHVTITIDSQGRADYISELGAEITSGESSKDDWTEAFEWISMDLTCTNCKTCIERWVDLETM